MFSVTVSTSVSRPVARSTEHTNAPGACPLVKLMELPSSITTGSPFV
jgi:hypothetical protein